MIRQAQQGFKIAPLFANDQKIVAIDLVENHKMLSIFECVRMYTDTPPDIDWTKIFGVTTLELG